MPKAVAKIFAPRPAIGAWRGRASAGQRLVARIPHGHYQTSTLIAGVGLRGACAPWLFDGAMDGEMFLAWARQGLAGVLQLGIIMGNFLWLAP
jgi:hypothetical protein